MKRKIYHGFSTTKHGSASFHIREYNISEKDFITLINSYVAEMLTKEKNPEQIRVAFYPSYPFTIEKANHLWNEYDSAVIRGMIQEIPFIDHPDNIEVQS